MGPTAWYDLENQEIVQVQKIVRGQWFDVTEVL